MLLASLEGVPEQQFITSAPRAHQNHADGAGVVPHHTVGPGGRGGLRKTERGWRVGGWGVGCSEEDGTGEEWPEEDAPGGEGVRGGPEEVRDQGGGGLGGKEGGSEEDRPGTAGEET